MILNNTDVSGALDILGNHNHKLIDSSHFSFKKQYIKSIDKIDDYQFGNIKEYRLIKYLSNRFIEEEVWKNCSHLFECSYSDPRNTSNGRRFYNLAWKNDSGGYELNNHNFKSCWYKKDITTIPGDESELNIFEGFFDFLSALTYFEVEELKGTVIILNSVSLVHKIVPKLISFPVVNSFLDNDSPGKQAFCEITKTNQAIINQSQIIYPTYNDFNDFIVDQ
ncbi:MAG: toprim domain-containing protein [Bacteroidota bacterium]